MGVWCSYLVLEVQVGAYIWYKCGNLFPHLPIWVAPILFLHFSRLNIMTTTSQKAFLNAFSWMTGFRYWLRIMLELFLSFQLRTSRCWFRYYNYLNQHWRIFLALEWDELINEIISVLWLWLWWNILSMAIWLSHKWVQSMARHATFQWQFKLP